MKKCRGNMAISGSRVRSWDPKTCTRDDPLPWHHSSDVWSLGCIFAELCTGEMLFPAHDNMEHLMMLEVGPKYFLLVNFQAVLGPLPQSILERASPEVHQKYIVSSRDSRGRRR